jgi:hypothetical protein
MLWTASNSSHCLAALPLDKPRNLGTGCRDVVCHRQRGEIAVMLS